MESNDTDDQFYYQIFIDDEWHKDVSNYEEAMYYAEHYAMGCKVEIKKFKV